MKKLITVFLVFVMVLGLCACGAGESKTEGLQIGYARESILPEGQVNISGGGNQAQRVSTGYLDILYATCLAVSEDDTTVLLYSTDTLTAKTAWTNEARQMISKATGVPEDNIQIAGTHTHSGPAVGGAEQLVAEWKSVYLDALVNAAKNAIADQAAATLYGAKVETEQMTFVRHYLMSDGTYAGSNFGDWSSGIVDHATEADEEMLLVKIERGEDKKDILLMNFQAHPTFVFSSNYTYQTLSADFIGVTRDAVEKETGMQFIYFPGSAGNQVATSQITSENGPHNKDHKLYGEALAQYAIDAIATMTAPIEGSGIKTKKVMLEYKSNDYGQDRLADAKLVNQKFLETGDASACNAYAKSLGFHSVYECNGIVSCSQYPATGTMELNVCSFGGIGFVAAPYEMFSNSGMYIKGESPFEFTLISTTTNGYNNYYPTKEAFAYGCYESFTARFASGVAEDTAEQFVQMLKEIQ